MTLFYDFLRKFKSISIANLSSHNHFGKAIRILKTRKTQLPLLKLNTMAVFKFRITTNLEIKNNKKNMFDFFFSGFCPWTLPNEIRAELSIYPWKKIRFLTGFYRDSSSLITITNDWSAIDFILYACFVFDKYNKSIFYQQILMHSVIFHYFNFIIPSKWLLLKDKLLPEYSINNNQLNRSIYQTN